MHKTILPSNATPLEIALDLNTAKSLAGLPPVEHLWSAQKCPLPLLPFLAWALSVDEWDNTWPEHKKRQVVQSSVFVHRHKGTRASMEAALKALDFGSAISEWFEHGGDPYTFRVDVYVSNGLTSDDIRDVQGAIRNTKNARSWLERLRIYLTSEARTYVAPVLSIGRTTAIQPLTQKLRPVNFISRRTAALVSYRTLSVEPI